MNRAKNHESGTVLIISLVTSIILAGLMVSLVQVSYSGHNQVKNESAMLKSLYIAEGASERIRVQLVNDYRQSQMSLPNWLNSVRQGDRFRDEENYSGHDTTRVTAASPPVSRSGWLDTRAYASLNAAVDDQSIDLTSTAVRQRISFGATEIFNLAFLSARTDCMFCHLQIDGDVGSLDFFRPGWGIEGGSGANSGVESRINGDVFVAADISADFTDLTTTPKTINGTQITGNVEVNYSGPRLPEDRTGDGVPDFPTIDPEVARRNASGALTGGVITTIDENGVFSDPNARNSVTELRGSIDGNVILVGTPGNPIHIDGNIFVSGDVVIKGVTTGQGAIYSGRNVYVAGDLSYRNPPRVPGPSEDPDVVAGENLANDRDELRIAARSNIVLGNYTNLDDNGNLLAMKDRQQELFFRDQFVLHGDAFFDHTTGQELKRDGIQFFNDQGREIDQANIVQADEYDGVIKPSYVNADGSVDLWMSDEEYRDILGTQTLRDYSWRIQLRGTGSEVTQGLHDNGFTASEVRSLTRGWNDGVSTSLSGDLVGPDYELIVRRVNDGLHSYPNEVERVDAFLYSNRRIAGKTAGTNLVVNGGMISEEIGVLAPGHYKFYWMRASRYNYLNTLGNQENPLNDGLYRHMRINYDYRLRNGGFGFDFVQGSVGRRLFWNRN